MFRTLLSDIRIGVISRMFLVQPRRPGAPATEKPAPEPAPLPGAVKPVTVQESNKKKRKRH